jgi:hypothetical protein
MRLHKLTTILAAVLLLALSVIRPGFASADDALTVPTVSCKEWTRTALEPYMDYERDIIAFLDQGGNPTEATVSDFCIMFGVAIDNANDSQSDVYVAVSAPVVHTYNMYGFWESHDANELGWQPWFDKWHTEGLF